jgi:hypothetical protein
MPTDRGWHPNPFAKPAKRGSGRSWAYPHVRAPLRFVKGRVGLTEVVKVAAIRLKLKDLDPPRATSGAVRSLWIVGDTAFVIPDHRFVAHIWVDRVLIDGFPIHHGYP